MHSLIRSFVHSFNQSINQFFNQFFNQSIIQSFIHSFTHSLGGGQGRARGGGRGDAHHQHHCVRGGTDLRPSGIPLPTSENIGLRLPARLPAPHGPQSARRVLMVLAACRWHARVPQNTP